MAVREIVVVGMDARVDVAGVVKTLSSMTRHSVVVEADAGRGRVLPSGGEVFMGTRFHQERRVARAEASRCRECGRCAKVCAAGAISFAPGIVVDIDRCTGCGKCVDVCPREVLTLSVMTDACVRTSATPYGRSVHADLAPDGRTSQGLVFALREEGRRQAKMLGADAIWIEAPRGRDELVAVALAGADAVLAVVPDGAGTEEWRAKVREVLRDPDVALELLVVTDSGSNAGTMPSGDASGCIFRVASDGVTRNTLKNLHAALLPPR
jgi:ferredoxin